MSEIIKADPFAVGFPTDEEFKQTGTMASLAIKSGLFKGAGRQEATVAIILKGREMQVPPIWSLERIHPIPSQGVVNLSIDGQGMLALIRRYGSVNYHVKHQDNGAANCTMKRDGDEEATVITWTMADATMAGLAGKGNWSKYPKAMLRWRAIADCARIVCPDLISGLYLADEVGAETDEDGSPVYRGKEVVTAPPDQILQEEAADAEFAPVKDDPEDLPLEQNVNPPKSDSPDSVAWACKYCGDIFEAEVALETHIETNHNEERDEDARKEHNAKVDEAKAQGDLLEAPKEEPKPEPQNNKKLSKQLNILWSQKIKGLGVALEVKVPAIVSDSMMVEFIKETAKVDPSTFLDDEGSPHASMLSESHINKLIGTLKHNGLMDGLKRLYASVTTGTQVEGNSGVDEKPKAEEKSTKDTEVDSSRISEKIKNAVTSMDEDFGMDGLKVTLKIQKKYNLIGGSDVPVEQMESCLKELTQAYRELLTGKSVEQVLADFSK